MMISEAVKLFVISFCAGKSNSTPGSYHKKLKRLVLFCGQRELESVTLSDLEQFRLALLTQSEKRRGGVVVLGPLSVWTVRSVLRPVRTFFKWCYEQGYIEVNPAARLKIPKAPQLLPKALSQETFEKLLHAAATSGDIWVRARNVALLCLLRDTGARISGLLSARLCDLDLEAGSLVVTEKGKTHTVYFNLSAGQALQRWLVFRSSLPVQSDAVFIGRRGWPLSYSGFQHLLVRLVKVAGVSGQRCNAHSFRHAFARDTLRAGADLSQVSQLMGHSTVSVTNDYYARWLPSELKDIHASTSPGRCIELEVILIDD